jgi:hypothetical protein
MYNYNRKKLKLYPEMGESSIELHGFDKGHDPEEKCLRTESIKKEWICIDSETSRTYSFEVNL